MERNIFLESIAIFDALYAHKILDIPWVILHLLVKMPFHGECESELVFVQVQLVLPIKSIELCVLGQRGVVPL